MVYTLIDHRNDVNMFKTQVEPRAAGKWFHCKVLNTVFGVIAMVYKSLYNDVNATRAVIGRCP